MVTGKREGWRQAVGQVADNAKKRWNRERDCGGEGYVYEEGRRVPGLRGKYLYMWTVPVSVTSRNLYT